MVEVQVPAVVVPILKTKFPLNLCDIWDIAVYSPVPDKAYAAMADISKFIFGGTRSDDIEVKKISLAPNEKPEGGEYLKKLDHFCFRVLIITPKHAKDATKFMEQRCQLIISCLHKKLCDPDSQPESLLKWFFDEINRCYVVTWKFE